MLKVGYILKKFPRLSETFILNEMLALESAGFELEVYSLRSPDDEPRHALLERLKAPVHVVRPAAARSVFRYLDTLAKRSDEISRERLTHLCRRLDPSDPWRFDALNMAVAVADQVCHNGLQHLHAHFGTIATATAGEVSLLTGVPFSFTMHAKDIYRHGVSFETLSRRMEQAAFCVTVCEANAEWLHENCEPQACRNLKVLYNGVDLSEWKPNPDRREAGVFAAVGRLVEKKGFEDYLRACAILRNRKRSFRAYLLGRGELESKLRGLIQRLKLQDCVEMPGGLPQEQVRDLLSRASLLVAPCVVASDGNQDALPTVLLEAMALGTPCVATAVGGICEIIRSEREGWIVPPRSPEALATVMEETLDDPEKARTRGKAARRRVEEIFDLKLNAGRLSNWMADARAGRKNSQSIVGAMEVPVR